MLNRNAVASARVRLARELGVQEVLNVKGHKDLSALGNVVGPDVQVIRVHAPAQQTRDVMVQAVGSSTKRKA